MKELSEDSGVLVPSRAEIMRYVCEEAARIMRVSDADIHPDSDLAAMMDSLDAISMLLALDRRFEIDLEGSSLNQLQTPERITNVIGEHLEGKVRLSISAQGSWSPRPR
jgi:acyl carrier protein